MSTEQLAGAAVLVAIGLGLIVTGVLGRRGSLDYSLGGWTKGAATPKAGRGPTERSARRS